MAMTISVNIPSSPEQANTPPSTDGSQTPVSPNAVQTLALPPPVDNAPAPANADKPAPGQAKRKPSRRANTAERRATHNAVERQRRETLNGRFLVCIFFPTRIFLKSHYMRLFIRTWLLCCPTSPKFVVLPSLPSSTLPSPTFRPLAVTVLLLPVSSVYSRWRPMPSAENSTNGETALVSPASRNPSAVKLSK